MAFIVGYNIKKRASFTLPLKNFRHRTALHKLRNLANVNVQ